jgi:protein involved in polysaccharide export with SLBB domain
MTGVWVFAVVVALLRASLAFAQIPAAARPADAVAGTADALRPGDVIRLRIWREPDLSGEFTVDETGVAVLPKVGPVQVGAESAASLRTKLVAAYSAFLNHTSIDVTLLRRVQVLGAVRQPGVYPVDPTMTISDVLAVAGGTTSDGDPNRLELIRDGKRIPGRIPRQSLVGESRVRSGDQIFVPERSWVRRNSGFLVGTVITTGVSVLLTLATR